IFSAPPEKQSLAWGAGTTCFMVPREKAGRKSEKKVYVSKPRFHDRLRQQRGATEVNKQGRKAHLWRRFPSPPNPRGKTLRAATTPGPIGIAAWSGGRSPSSRPNSRRGSHTSRG